MASLIAKKLSKLPVGTHVEVTYGDGAAHHEKVRGVITDSDFTANVEITPEQGEEIVLDYSIVRGVQVLKNLETVLRELPEGTKVRFSWGNEDQKEPNIDARVVENDNESGLELLTDKGEELTLSYGEIRSLLVLSGSAPVKAPVAQPKPVEPVTPKKTDRKPEPVVSAPQKPLCRQEPSHFTNLGDRELKDQFDAMTREERKLLSSVYERFKYGVKVNDKSKMTDAAQQARKILFEEDEAGLQWTGAGARFCGGLMRRVAITEYQVYLVGECFEEAAWACWKLGKWSLAGAYAVLALLDEPVNRQDLYIILACAQVNAEDISGLRVLRDRGGDAHQEQIRALLAEALAVRGIRVDGAQDIGSGLELMKSLWPNAGMEEEICYWRPEENTSSEQAEEIPGMDGQEVPEKKPQPTQARVEYGYGVISRLNWMDHTGVITGEDGLSYTFRYADIVNPELAKIISECMRADLEGKTYLVKFTVQGNAARNVQPDDALVDRARTIAADATREDRFQRAFDLCKKAVGTADSRRALGDLMKHAMKLNNAGNTGAVREALAYYEKNITYFPNNAFAVMDVAMCYGYTKKYPQMMEHAEKALAFPGLLVRQKVAVLSAYMKMARDYYEVSGDKALVTKMLEKIDEVRSSYERDFKFDPDAKRLYTASMLHQRIYALCVLERVEEAEADYEQLPVVSIYKTELGELLEKTRQKVCPKPAEPEAVAEEAEAEPELPEEEADELAEAEAEDYDEPAAEEEAEQEILPYEDHDGWEALKLTKKAVVDYALGISGPERIPAILAYLHAGAGLNSQIAPVYRTVALAANDPLVAPDYGITALVDALAGSDSDYPELNDCCMGAAYLRSSFLAGRGYDYSAQGLRDSISISQRLDALRSACDTLEAFRKETGRAIDIYADYRNQGAKKLKDELDAAVSHADELYTKYILTPAREGVKLFRLLETKKILFAKDGYLATMLRHVMERDQDALEAQKEHFIQTYLNGAGLFSPKHISATAIDDMIAEGWELAGKNMQVRRGNAPLQGGRRNHLRSNIFDILTTICQWYALSEQGAGLTWRTEQGDAAYQRLKPLLMEQLEELSRSCDEELDGCTDPQMSTGLFLLRATALELHARLEGSWKFDQEKYLYVDFLRGSSITLNDDFMPELSSTFCALPEFNVLARIRHHVENPRRGFQEQINAIYGMDKTCNNYGTAQRILEYLAAMGQEGTVRLPENAERFVNHSEMQVDMRFRSFRETYALAMNYGQIIKSDAFCYTLEDTVRYWYAFCKESKNFGFFTSILLQAENQIHASARQYETQLDEQLDALIASNQQYFDQHPDYAEAIRAQIGNQNFTVAEDWMSRIRIGDFSLEVQQPEALGYLERFWNSFVATYKRVSDASRPLISLLGRREVRNKDTKRAQQLIDNWLNNGNPSNSQRIEQLLNLLGWQNIQVSQYHFAGEPRGEIYQVSKQPSAAGLAAPLHPIAAFGSGLEKKRMYVVCLYGIYDCDRLYEKMRSLDVIDGSKIILLDYALGQADRRELARKLKKRESGLRNVNMVIDRVLITHLASNYNENLINRILMATAMPFAYCQPYVVESVHTMPPEIFIGRKDELHRIEDPKGVNLIYGGRQLGKSALFKKALADIDGHQRQRAVLIDIKELDYAGAARKLSTKLIDLNITPDAEVTDDWDVLCRSIERRLRSQEDEIVYFLLMLDEADAFINDCANCGYRPLVALKDVQQSLPERFKYVLAGLHNIVKFNRQVALGNNSVITHMPSLKITPFHTPEAQELLTVPLSYLGFSLPSKVTVSQILATCNYFPGLIQLYAKKLIESIRAADYAGYDIKKTPPYVVSDEHLRRVMSDKEFMDQIHEKFEITLTLDQDQGSCYYPLTLLIGWMYSVMPSKSGYTARDVVHHARDLAVHPLAELDEEKISALLQELQDLNILRSVSNDSYLLASKNFRDLLGSDEEIFEKLMKIGGVAV